MKLAAIHLGSDYHLLDHIAPLCDLLKMPLYMNEDSALVHHYYPQIQVIEWPDLELRWDQIAKNADVLFRCGYWPPHLKKMFLDLYQKTMHLVFCPHGQSDKGDHSTLLEPYREQELVLLYGKLMKEQLKKRNIHPRHLIVGNVRLTFYQRHQKWYDALVEKEIFSKLNPAYPTILYAPTWEDCEMSSSFFTLGRRLLQKIPLRWNLIVKPHPHLESRSIAKYHALVAEFENKPNIFWLDRFPLIYPLLNRTDIYIGDASSVGYDFLFFQRPMFFLPTTFPNRLTQCGLLLDVNDPNQTIEMHLPHMKKYQAAQQKLYRLAFGNQKACIPNMLQKSGFGSVGSRCL